MEQSRDTCSVSGQPVLKWATIKAMREVQEKCFGFQRESIQQKGIGEGFRKEATSKILKNWQDVSSRLKENREGGKSGIGPRKSRKWIVDTGMVPGDSKCPLRATVGSKAFSHFISAFYLFHTLSFYTQFHLKKQLCWSPYSDHSTKG